MNTRRCGRLDSVTGCGSGSSFDTADRRDDTGIFVRNRIYLLTARKVRPEFRPRTFWIARSDEDVEDVINEPTGLDVGTQIRSGVSFLSFRSN